MTLRSHPGRPGARRAAAAALSLALLSASCASKRGDDAPPPTAPAGPTATLTGTAIGGSGLPLAGLSVSSVPSAGPAAVTNSSGFFSLTVPANTKFAATGRAAGYAPHPVSAQLATGETRSVALVMAPLGATQTVFTAAGGTVADPGSKSAVTLPSGFVTGSSSAQVSVTGIDPTSSRVIAMPGTFAARNVFGGAGALEPFAIADVRLGDGAGGSFALATPALLRLRVPDALATDARVAIGQFVPCFRYDDTAGEWQGFATGEVFASPVDGKPEVRVTVASLSWFAAGFLNGSNACVEGVVSGGGAGVAGATVQAYPGGAVVSGAGGAYRVSVPPETFVRLIATRPATGSVSLGSATATGGALGTPCVTVPITLAGGGASTFFTVEAEISRGRALIGVPRDAATVRIRSTAATPVPLNGARVDLEDPTHLRTLPQLANGVYGMVTGQSPGFSLIPGEIYTLRVDLEPDGVVDATAQVLMPGQPLITEPLDDDVLAASFTASWSDPLSGQIGYSARYIGSVESGSFGTFPAIFTDLSPGASHVVGTGTGQPQFSMPNDPLVTGGYVFRLWATNGPVRYPVGNTVQFATPNLVGSRITGWFSAVAKADSVRFNSIGDGGPRPAAMPAYLRRR